VLDKVWQSTSEVVRERLSSPVLVPFALAWLGFNYKLIVYVFSGVGVPRVFQLIHEQLYPTPWHYLFQGFLCPLTVAALLVFALPHLERWVLEKTLKTQNSIVDLRQQHAHAIRLTLADSQALRDDMRKQAESHRLENDERRAETDEIKEMYGEKVKAVQDLQERLDNVRPAKPDPTPGVLSDTESRILVFLHASKGAMSRFQLLHAKLGIAEEIDHAIHLLERRGMLLQAADSGTGSLAYSPSGIGRMVARIVDGPGKRESIATQIIERLMKADNRALEYSELHGLYAPDESYVDETVMLLYQHGLVELLSGAARGVRLLDAGVEVATGNAPLPSM